MDLLFYSGENVGDLQLSKLLLNTVEISGSAAVVYR